MFPGWSLGRARPPVTRIRSAPADRSSAVRPRLIDGLSAAAQEIERRPLAGEDMAAGLAYFPDVADEAACTDRPADRA